MPFLPRGRALGSPAGRRSLEPRLDRPLPFWTLFPLIFVVVYLLHIALLRLPYYWDEAGYYIPAAYDFFRSGALIPYSTLPNGHPPLPSIYLSLWWLASGFTPAVTRTSMCVIAALGLLAVFRLGLRLTHRPQVAGSATLLTMIYPVWFAQSTLAHADMFAAAATLWGLVYFFNARESLASGPSGEEQKHKGWGKSISASVICFSVAALSKETAIVTPVAIALWLGYRRLRASTRKPGPPFELFLLIPILPLAGWYGFYWTQTGYLFGNPGYWQYNAGSTIGPLRFFVALGHRLFDITAHMNLFVPVLCALGALMLVPLLERNGSRRPRISTGDQVVLYVVLAANLIFFSVFGGALLTRYLLPLYPLVLLLAASTLRRRVRYWWALIGLSAAAFVIGLFINPPYQFAPEDNLTYVSMIRLQQKAIGQIEKRFPGRTVLTAWPATDELSKPMLGYVKKPVPVVAVDNFSAADIKKAAAESGSYSVVFAFSTKYDPPHSWLSLGRWNQALDKRYFGFHHDMTPSAIGRMLGERVVWHDQRKGLWAALLETGPPGIAVPGTTGENHRKPPAPNYNHP